MPSYVGSSIINKPAYLKRNEKFHSNLHNDYIPTIKETIKMIDMWVKFKNSQPCTNAPNMTIAEVLENRNKQNIDKSLLCPSCHGLHRNPQQRWLFSGQKSRDRRCIPNHACSCLYQRSLKVMELQLEGKKRMTTHDFLLGVKVQPGELLGER